MFALPFIIVLFGQGLDALATYVTVGFIVLSLGLGALLLLKKFRKHSFVFEVIYCAGFLVSISFLAHR